jgi:transposase-like protein
MFGVDHGERCASPLIVLLLLYGLLACYPFRLQRAPLPEPNPASPHPLKPRTPHDCPACRAADPPPATPRPAPTPWCLRKSPRGRPKFIATQGFACPNQACDYYAITDAAVHALVGDGTRGKAEPIQTFRCQCCQATFSSRRDTPLYRLKTPSARIAQVVAALAEGLDVAAAARVFGYAEAAISTWLSRTGEHMQRLPVKRLQGLHIAHIQLDEIRTRLRLRERVLWLWVAVDPVRQEPLREMATPQVKGQPSSHLRKRWASLHHVRVQEADRMSHEQQAAGA